MSAVIGGLTLLQVVQIVAALAGTGKSTVDLVDWIEKREAAGVDPAAPLLPQHEHDARKLIEKASDTDSADGFINGVLGR